MFKKLYILPCKDTDLEMVLCWLIHRTQKLANKLTPNPKPHNVESLNFTPITAELPYLYCLYLYVAVVFMLLSHSRA